VRRYQGSQLDLEEQIQYTIRLRAAWEGT